MKIDANKKNLFSFGLGLAILLLIPGFAFWMKHVVAWPHYMLIAAFILFLMFAGNKMGFLLYALYFMPNMYCMLNSMFGWQQLLFIVFSLGFLLVTIVNCEWLKKIYCAWMPVANGIGTLVTSTILIFVFYGLFAPIGLFFRLIKKDYMERAVEKGRPSYWVIRRQEGIDKDRYTKQF